MKKRKLVFAAVSLFLVQLAAYSAFGAVGESYSTMAQRYGAPGHVSLKMMVGTRKAAVYEASGASSYAFNINKFTVYALFNANNVCFRMLTLHNRTLPAPSMFVGPLVNTTPTVLFRAPLRAIILEYGAGSGAVIYRTFGLPGDLSAEAYSKALEP